MEMELDAVASLTQDGPHFEQSWGHFLFNVDAAMNLKKSVRPKEEVLGILLAGARYQGTGWTTGRASKALYDLSGVGIVKPAIEPYRDCWLYALALLTGVDLPTVDLPADCAEAAFSMVSYLESKDQQDQGTPDAPCEVVEESDDSDAELRFAWDEPATPIPKELQALWSRASKGEHRILIKELLETHPRLDALPTRAPENNLLPEHRKKVDSTLKAFSQQVLNVLRIWSYRWLRPPNQQTDLQTWQ
jgi:hypothetical protein